MDWIRDNWAQIGVIALLVRELLKAIAAATPTDKDDKAILKFDRFFDYLFKGKRPNG